VKNFDYLESPFFFLAQPNYKPIKVLVILHILKNLTLEIKGKFGLWKLVIDERNTYFERLKYLSETLLERLMVVHFCYKYI